MALDGAEVAGTGVPLEDLVRSALVCRSEMSAGGDSAARLARVLAYDVALVRLCQNLGVDHGLTDRDAGPEARAHTEETLARWVPKFASDAASSGAERLGGPSASGQPEAGHTEAGHTEETCTEAGHTEETCTEDRGAR